MHPVDEYGVGRKGHKVWQTIGGPGTETFYKVEARGTAAGGTGTGSCAWWGHPTIEAAEAHAAELRAHNNNAQYSEWYVVEYRPVTEIRIAKRLT